MSVTVYSAPIPRDERKPALGAAEDPKAMRDACAAVLPRNPPAGECTTCQVNLMLARDARTMCDVMRVRAESAEHNFELEHNALVAAESDRDRLAGENLELRARFADGFSEDEYDQLRERAEIAEVGRKHLLAKNGELRKRVVELEGGRVEAAELGYCAGHDDTVESRYGDPLETAQDIVADMDAECLACASDCSMAGTSNPLRGAVGEKCPHRNSLAQPPSEPEEEGEGMETQTRPRACIGCGAYDTCIRLDHPMGPQDPCLPFVTDERPRPCPPDPQEHCEENNDDKCPNCGGAISTDLDGDYTRRYCCACGWLRRWRGTKPEGF